MVIMSDHVGLISCMVCQISENEESLAGKDPGGCSNSLFELDTLHERISELMSSAASCSSKDDDDMVISC